METTKERAGFKINGFLILLVEIVILAAIVALLVAGLRPGLLLFIPFFFIAPGFIANPPNQCRILVFFGKYTGTVRDSGFFWVNPLAVKTKVSFRVNNFNSEKIKVNDNSGNPIEIAAVVVWKVVDSAKASFDVEDYKHFVSIQSESALRSIANAYPYDSHEDNMASLHGSPKVIAEALKKEVQERLNITGIEILETRITHLAYAPEIAHAMLRRQQAQAIIMARKKIVEGAVGMVEMALQHLSEKHIIELDEDKKATMVNNLLVSLTSDRDVQPIINTGTLFQ
jgi:regulator of protease activity HflC (stomatin/prohibitin superfamily)